MTKLRLLKSYIKEAKEEGITSSDPVGVAIAVIELQDSLIHEQEKLLEEFVEFMDNQEAA